MAPAFCVQIKIPPSLRNTGGILPVEMESDYYCHLRVID